MNIVAPVGELDGLVVVDGSTGVSGAYASKLLGDAGATVTVVEPPGGSPLRRWAWMHDVPDGADGRPVPPSAPRPALGRHVGR